MDINSLFSLKQAWSSFCLNHPKFPFFLKAVKDRGAVAGAELSIVVSYPDGQTLKAGLRLKESDAALINNLSQMI